MHCHNCGGENRAGYKFCVHCGTPSAGTSVQETVVIPGQSPVGPFPGGPPHKPAKRGPKLFNNNALLLGGASIGLLLVVILAVVAVNWFLDSGAGGNRLLLAFPDRGGENDLYLLRLEQTKDEGTLIAEDVRAALGYFWVSEAPDQFIPVGSYEYGGFVPESDVSLFWYQDDDGDIFLNKMRAKDDQPTLLFDSNSSYLMGRVLGDGRDIFVVEPRDDQERCYFSQSGAEAERVAKGDECSLSVDGSTVFVVDWDGEKFSLVAMDTDGDNEIKLLDDQENILSWIASQDGSRVAYFREEDETQVILLDRATGEGVVEGEDVFGVVDYGFARQGSNFYFIAETDDGDLGLYTLDSGGSSLVTTSVTLNAAFSPDGKHLAYLIGDEDGEETFYVHSMAGGDDVEIARGEDLQFGLMSSPAQFILLDQAADELTLSSLNPDGGGLVQIYNEDDMYLDWVSYIPGKADIYVMLRDTDGMYSLFATDVGRQDGFILIEEWASIQILNRSPEGRFLVFVGQEDRGDDPVLYSIEVGADARPVELDDDADEYTNAVFTSDGKEILYTAVTGYDSTDVEVRRVPANGDGRYERLYDEALLVDVQWGSMNPFEGIYFQETLSSTSFCPGARPLSLDNSLAEELAAGEEACYRFRADANQVYTIVAASTSEMDHPFFSVYDRDGNYLDGGGSGQPLRLDFDQAGTYFIKVSGYYSSDSGDYNVAVYEGLTDLAFTQATTLLAGTLTRGAITSASYLYLETYEYSTYGTMYTFDGQAGDQIIIDVFADSIGSSLDPAVYLFDSLQELLDEDDDGGSGYDSQLTYALPESGQYYLLVEDASGDYGSEDSYFYDILLTMP